VILSAVCGTGSLVLLIREQSRYARLLAIGAVVSVIVAWGVAQWDYILPQTLTVSQAAAPTATLEAVLIATALAVLLIFPSLGLLYTLDQRGLLPDEGLDDLPAPSA
jgi:cytochrome d ubiquinol oxidase subunit II